jgi:hypothetical protein
VAAKIRAQNKSNEERLALIREAWRRGDSMDTESRRTGRKPWLRAGTSCAKILADRRAPTIRVGARTGDRPREPHAPARDQRKFYENQIKRVAFGGEKLEQKDQIPAASDTERNRDGVRARSEWNRVTEENGKHTQRSATAETKSWQCLNESCRRQDLLPKEESNRESLTQRPSGKKNGSRYHEDQLEQHGIKARIEPDKEIHEETEQRSESLDLTSHCREQEAKWSFFEQESSREIELLHTHSTHRTRAENERTHATTAKTKSLNKRWLRSSGTSTGKTEEHNRNTKKDFFSLKSKHGSQLKYGGHHLSVII